ncbi:MAG: DUF4271 domain-containing protein [Bacteroidales bacterium]
MERDRREKAEELLSLTGNHAGQGVVLEDEVPVYIGQDPVNLSSPASDTLVGDSGSPELPDTLLQIPPVTEISTLPESSLENQQDTLKTIEIQNAVLAVPDSTGIISDTPGNINASGSVNLTSSGSDSLQNSVWDRIETRERQIDSSRISSTVAPARPAPVKENEIKIIPEKTFRYDASEFLENGRKFDSNQYLFPSKSKDGSELSGPYTVFNQPNPSSINKANGAYIAYIQEDNESNMSFEIHQSTIWIPALVILSLLLLAWIKLIYVQFLTPVLVSAFNYKESVKLYHGKNAPAQNAFLILNVIFAINGGLFLLFVSGFFNLDLPDIKPVLLFLGAFACLVLLYMLKSFSLKLLGFLFDKQRLFSEYSYNISLYNKIYGLLLLPLVVGILYGSDVIHDTIIYAGLALGGVFYLLQLFRGFEIIVRKDFSIFYLILYLCAFEIFPIMVIYKVVQTFFM